MATSEFISQAKDVIETLGVVGAGLWAAWTFAKLQSVRAAEVEIAKSQAETKKTSAETEAIHRESVSQQPLLKITIRARDECVGTSTRPEYMNVEVLMKNEGQQNLDIELNDDALIVACMKMDKSKRPLPTDVYRCGHWLISGKADKPERVGGRFFRVGQERTIPFLVPIQDDGVYFVQFQARYAKRPFEGDKQPKKEPDQILAYEQCFVCIPAHPPGAASSTS